MTCWEDPCKSFRGVKSGLKGSPKSESDYLGKSKSDASCCYSIVVCVCVCVRACACSHVNSTLVWWGRCWNSAPAKYLVCTSTPDHNEYKMLVVIDRLKWKTPSSWPARDLQSHLDLKVLLDWRWTCGWIDLSSESCCFCAKYVKNKFRIAALLRFSRDSYYHPLKFLSNNGTY